MTEPVETSKAAPAGTGILHLLTRIRRKVRTILIVRGIFLASGTALIALLAAIGTDALFAPDSPALRWLITGTVCAVALAGLAIFLFRPATRKVPVSEIARVLEVRHPELEERLSNALDIMGKRESVSPVTVSDELLEHTLKDAEHAATKIRPGREFIHHNWWRYATVAAVPIAVLFVLALLWPDQLGRLFSRVIDPGSEQGNVYASRMQITPGDAWVREGDPLIIALETENFNADRAELVRRPIAEDGDSGETPELETCEAMTLVANDGEGGSSRFMIKFPAVADGFEYQVNSGIGSSDLFRIDVRRWPEITELKTTLDYPEYTHLEQSVSEFGGDEISAPIGTKVTYEAKFAEPVESARLRLPGGEVLEADIGDAAAGTWQFVIGPAHNGDWGYTLANRWEMETESDPFPMRALTDAPPSIQLLEPAERRVIAKADGKVGFGYQVGDDYGVRVCVLHIIPDRGEPMRYAVDLAFSDPVRKTSGRGSHEFELSDLEHPQTRRLIAFMRVWDNRPPALGDMQSSDSRAIIIDIDRTDGPLRDPTSDSAESDLRAKALQELRQARQQAEELRNALRQGDRWNANPAQLDKLSGQIAKADAAVEALAEEREQLGQTQHAQEVRDISAAEVKPAGRAAKAVAGDPKKRVENSEYAERKLAEAIQKLENSNPPAGAPPSFESPLAELVNLTEQQKQLAQEAAAQAAENPAQPMDPDWQKRQEELARAMAQAEARRDSGPP